MILIGIVLFLIVGVCMYNDLVRCSVKADESLSGIDVALSKRYNVLVQLQNTVKGA